MIASREGYIDIVKHLLNAPGIDLGLRSSEGHTAISYASAEGHTETVDLLLSSTGSTPHNV
jgi:ankyrin repeat protein